MEVARFLASPGQLPDSYDLDENEPSFRHFTSVTGNKEPTHAGRERLKRGGGKDGVCWHIGGNVVANDPGAVVFTRGSITRNRLQSGAASRSHRSGTPDAPI